MPFTDDDAYNCDERERVASKSRSATATATADDGRRALLRHPLHKSWERLRVRATP